MDKIEVRFTKLHESNEMIGFYVSDTHDAYMHPRAVVATSSGFELVNYESMRPANKLK